MTHAPSLNQVMFACWYWDKAGSKDAGAYTVGTLMYKMRKNVNPAFVIAKQVRGQWRSDEREKIIKQEQAAKEAEAEKKETTEEKPAEEKKEEKK